MTYLPYNQISEDFEAIARRRALFLTAVDQWVLEELRTSKEPKVLDVGAGNAERSTFFATNHPIRLTLVEPSTLISGRVLPDNVKLFQGSFEEFTSEENFDAILFLWSTLGHFAEWESALHKAWDLLCPGGTIMLDVNNFLNQSEYGLKSILLNLIRFSQKGIRFEASVGGNSLFVVLFPPSFGRTVRGLLPQATVEVEFRSYSTGRPSTAFGGQILAKISKPEAGN